MVRVCVALISVHDGVCAYMCGIKKKGETERRRGRVIERRKIDALSVCGADPVCLGDI